MNYIVTKPQIDLFLRRRFSREELEKLVDEIKYSIEEEGIMEEMAIYDNVRDFIKDRKFSDIDEFGDDYSYWKSYLSYEKPLVAYVKSQLDII